MVRHGNGREHDVTQNSPLSFSDEGNVWLSFSAKPVDKVGLSRRFELRGIQRMHRGMIVFSFRADQNSTCQTYNAMLSGGPLAARPLQLELDLPLRQYLSAQGCARVAA